MNSSDSNSSDKKKLNPKSNNELNRIKSSLFERTLSVAKMGFNAGLKYATAKATGKESFAVWVCWVRHTAWGLEFQ